MPTEIDPKNISESLRRSYSHGFEEIYALQDVDLSTVRAIDAIEQPEVKESKPSKICRSQPPAQISLPLGGQHCETMPSFVLEEPIQVLGLPAHLEAYLHGKKIEKIRTLIEEGELDKPEIASKFEDYTNGKLLYDCDRINFGAWLRSLLGHVPYLKAHIALEPYGLSYLYPLTPQLKVEWRRLDKAARLAAGAQTWEQWRTGGLASRFNESARKVADVYLRPWMRRRQGLAFGYELLERLERIGEDPDEARHVIQCLEANLTHSFIFDRCLCHADNGLYADSLETSQAYDQLIDVAMTYFYNEHLIYDFDRIVDFLLKELARRWDHFDELFVIRALRYSPQFRVRKGVNQKLQVWLA